MVKLIEFPDHRSVEEQLAGTYRELRALLSRNGLVAADATDSGVMAASERLNSTTQIHAFQAVALSPN
jgi:7-keto-8-aminopelargonate synthetase-like enzyme